MFEVKSSNDKYEFRYSLDDGNTMQSILNLIADYIVSKGYTGACLGLYCTSNGKKTEDDLYADFNWVSHKAFPRRRRSIKGSNAPVQRSASFLDYLGCTS